MEEAKENLKLTPLDNKIIELEIILINVAKTINDMIECINELRADNYCLDQQNIYHNKEIFVDYLKNFQELINKYQITEEDIEI